MIGAPEEPREEVDRPGRRGLDHRGEGRRFLVDVRRQQRGVGVGVGVGLSLGGKAGAGLVVADHGPVPAERLDVGPGARLAPVQLEVAHPPAREQQRRTGAAARPGDPAPVGSGEADRLLFHPASRAEMARTGHPLGPKGGSGAAPASLKC